MMRYFTITVLVLTILGFLVSPSHSASSYTAASCTQADIQAAVDLCAGDSGCTTVYLPTCDTTWVVDNGIDVEGNISIIGQGVGKTILRTTVKQTGGFFDHQNITDASPLVEYSGISFYANLITATTSAGITFWHVTQSSSGFRVHHCLFDGEWHGMISMKRTAKGLIDNNTFIRPTASTNYGITANSNYSSKPDLCDLEGAEIGCESTWNTWYLDPAYQDPPFDDNWIPGTENAIFVEDNIFHYDGAVIEGNWGSVSVLVFRYNTVYNTSYTNAGPKPGAIWWEIYNNYFEHEGGDGTRGAGLYFRCSGLVHNNTFKYYHRGGDLASYWCSNGYCYPEMVLMDELYIYDNTYTGCGCPGDTSSCWQEWPEGDPDRITEGENYFFRPPQPGDRIYPYTPYTYPHPLRGPATPHSPGESKIFIMLVASCFLIVSQCR